MRWMAGWIIILLIAGCTNHAKIPPGIIKQERMEKILWDMIQADRFVSSYIMTKIEDSPSVKKEKAAVYYENVFRLNGITRDEFLKSYKFYLGRPDITKKMFDSIAARAERMRPDLYKPTGRSILQSRRDSLLRADSTRIADSIEKIELTKPSTEELFADSVLDKKK